MKPFYVNQEECGEEGRLLVSSKSRVKTEAAGALRSPVQRRVCPLKPLPGCCCLVPTVYLYLLARLELFPCALKYALPLLTSHSLFSYCPISLLLIVNKSFESIGYTSWLHCPPPIRSSTHSSLAYAPTTPLRKCLMRPSKALPLAKSKKQCSVLIPPDFLAIDSCNWWLLVTLFGNCGTTFSWFSYHCLVVAFQFPLWAHWLAPNNSV